MQTLDRPKSQDTAPAGSAGERRSAEIVWLDDWRRKRRPKGFRWRRPPPVPVPPTPARNHAVPIEAWLMMLIVFSAIAGAMFALMAMGYLP